MALNKYNKLLNSFRWSNNNTNDEKILALVVVAQKLADDPNKSSDKSNTSDSKSTKVEPTYIRDLPTWML